MARMIFIMITAVFLFIEPSYAEFYEYVDKDGKTVFTDDMTKLPKDVRERFIKEAQEAEAEEAKGKEAEALKKAIENVRIPVKEADEPAAETPSDAPGVEAAVEKAAPAPVVKEFTVNDFIVLAAKGLGAVAGLLVMFYAVGRLSELIGYRRLGSAISIALTCFVLVYLLSTHLKELANSYKLIMRDVFKVKAQMEKKNEGADKALKEFDDAFRQLDQLKRTSPEKQTAE